MLLFGFDASQRGGDERAARHLRRRTSGTTSGQRLAARARRLRPAPDSGSGNSSGNSSGSRSGSARPRREDRHRRRSPRRSGVRSRSSWPSRNGSITKVSVLQYPNGNGRDVEIDAYSLPILIQETIKSQSANIDMVSGATYTSTGYIQSLQSALDQANL